jgi:pimeloyl-ACP methyl ester carboxylesterase
MLLIIARLCFPTWTPKISNKNSISELRKVRINETDIEVMIRGCNRDNPIIVFVHGGPCCSEIPYIRGYQDLLEQEFTIIHYDQRGSGKSYEFGTDYSGVTASTHVDDLIALTEYIKHYLNQEQVILIGHSYGTYIATMAAAKEQELYRAYIGIGQMSNTIESELDGLSKYIEAAKEAGNTDDVTYLSGLEKSISIGKGITPRNYVRKYGFAARNINENSDYLNGFLLGSEYNLLDAIRFYVASGKYQDALIMEALNNPIPDIVTEIDIPVYFVMGKYDCMTSPEAAEEYLNRLTGQAPHEMIVFENSAHYPQLEEKEKFYNWMCSTFAK